MEQSKRIERSELFKQINEIVKTLPIDSKGMDAPDHVSISSELEQLFLAQLKLNLIEVFHLSTDKTGLNAHILFQFGAKYDWVKIPVNPRELQLSIRGNMLVNQSEFNAVDAVSNLP